MNGCATGLDPAIAVALLAAGRASRFGADKLAAELAGKPVWQWAADAVAAAGFQARIAVVGPDGTPAGLARQSGWQIACNQNPADGLASSIRLAVHAAASARRLVIVLADMPFVDAAHLRALAFGDGAAFTRLPGGRGGVPAAFPASDFAVLAALEGDRGAAALADRPGTVLIEPAAREALLDVDRPADLARAAAIAARSGDGG
jgi:CTP:molybdopterin cytidylyltransferase MocA